MVAVRLEPVAGERYVEHRASAEDFARLLPDGPGPRRARLLLGVRLRG